MKYPCEACDFIGTQKGNLRTHTQSIYEGKKYPCEACDYIATRKDNLRTHTQSVHEGKKYPCDACDYIATQKGMWDVVGGGESDTVQWGQSSRANMTAGYCKRYKAKY